MFVDRLHAGGSLRTLPLTLSSNLAFTFCPRSEVESGRLNGICSLEDSDTRSLSPGKM